MRSARKPPRVSFLLLNALLIHAFAASTAQSAPPPSAPPHAFPTRLRGAQLRRGVLSGADNDPRLVGLARRLRRGEPLVAANLGASVTRDHAGHCGGAGCAWQLERKVTLPSSDPQHLRKDGWMNTFLDRVIETVYPNAEAPGHGFVNGGQAGAHPEQLSSCLKSVIPLDANLVVLDFTTSNGNRNVEEIIRLLDTYPKKPAVLFIILQTWALDENGVVDMKELQVTSGIDNVTEAKRRLALSVSNATAIRESNSKASREREVYELINTAKLYNATVMSLPAILIPELLADDTDAALEVWEAGRKVREARQNVPLVPDEAEGEEEEEEEEEAEAEAGQGQGGGRLRRRLHHYWPIKGWCDDGIHPRAQYDETKLYANWLSQMMAYALKRADVKAVALETANGGGGGGEKIEDTMPPLPEPFDKGLSVVVGAAHCYRWDCRMVDCPSFHMQDKAPFLAPRMVYNSTPANVVPGGPDGGTWGWHHTQHPIHGDVTKTKPGLVATAAGSVIGLAIDTAYRSENNDVGRKGDGDGEQRGHDVADSGIDGEDDRIAVNGEAAPKRTEQERVEHKEGGGVHAHDALVKIFYLTSYERMGMARVSCEDGCTCRPRTLDGHTVRHESVVNVAHMGVSQSENCTLRVEIVAESRDPKGGHKFKLFQINVTPPSSDETRNMLKRDQVREDEIIHKYNDENVVFFGN